MDKKRGLIDVPEFDPDERVAFPPTGPEHRQKVSKDTPPQKPAGKPYSESYASEWPTADPSQTTPGAPNIRNIDESMPTEEEMKKLSPDLDWKEAPQTAPMKSNPGSELPKPAGKASSSYKSDEKVAFPPKKPEDRSAQHAASAPQGVKGEPYSETYTSEWPTADPSQTTPGAPNIRNIDESMPTEEELKKLSPDLDWKETPQTASMKHDKK